MTTNCSAAWFHQLVSICDEGERVAPRGLPTLELIHSTVHVKLKQSVLCCPARKLNYRFMAAEAYWILTGDDTVAGIAPYNSHIAQFSDDGKKFAGAYGPRVKDQLTWVIDQLIDDPDTRHAGLVIWRDKPAPSRDIPCTVAIWFTIRDNHLDVHVFMRSSDVWLGLPYDIFNFSMLGWVVMGKLNQYRLDSSDVLLLQPGALHLTMVSSHLYESNFEAASNVICQPGALDRQNDVPDLYTTHPDELIELLKRLREPGNEAERWWL
jgi:thymidylate synthase